VDWLKMALMATSDVVLWRR